jgi:pectin lyase
MKTARPGRQHYVFGFNPSTRITLSNNHIDGKSPYSTGCGDGYHYWTFEMVGKGDQITMKSNWITRTGGRSPALSGSTLLHAVNNVWQDNSGHALEGGDTNARGIFEGNVFTNVKALSSDYQGRLFAASSANKDCNAAFKRACQANTFYNSQGALPKQDTSFFSNFAGLNIASAQSAASARANVPNNAGIGKI